jgi:transcriptional regulator with XRE-family HTH domain
MDEDRDVTLRLRDLRRAAGLSLQVVAAQVGVHPMTVARWERGERFPAPAVQADLAVAFGVSRETVVRAVDCLRPHVRAGMPGVPGRALRPLRRDREISVRRLAAAAEVPEATVYNWEHGRARIPLSKLPALAEALGSRPEALGRVLRTAPHPRVERVGRSALARLRHRAGFNQAEASRRARVSRSQLRAWERGVTPPLAAARRLAWSYGCSMSAVASATGLRLDVPLDPNRWGAGQFALVVRILRQWKGLTQRELAARVGCSVGSIQGWEAARYVPRQRHRELLERALGLTNGALLKAYPLGEVPLCSARS